MKLSKTEVEFATNIVRKLLLSSMGASSEAPWDRETAKLAQDNPLFERIAHADLETLIVLGKSILTEQGWDVSENPCTYKVGNTWKGPKSFV